MDAEERSRLRKDLWLYHQAPDGTPKRRSGREFVSRIPQLLGALDAAEAEAARYRGLLRDVVRGDKDMCECEGECFFCGGWVQDMGYEGHAADCPWIAAVVALAATEPDEP